MKERDLSQTLKKYNVPFNEWGKDNAKTFGHLLKEINDGESRIEMSEIGLLRVEEGVAVNLFYCDGERLLKLYEAEQRFKDGRIRKRNYPTSFGEKMGLGETPHQALKRAFSEELGIGFEDDTISKVKFNTEDRKPVISTSFPGLLTKRVIHVSDIELPEKYFNPDGYIEKQEDKTTVFKWKEIKNSHT